MVDKEFSQNIDINNGSNVCVFLFHGLSATPYELKTWAEKIAELKADVKVPLLPYHGVDSDLLCSVDSADEFYEWGSRHLSAWACTLLDVDDIVLSNQEKFDALAICISADGPIKAFLKGKKVFPKTIKS